MAPFAGKAVVVRTSYRAMVVAGLAALSAVGAMQRGGDLAAASASGSVFAWGVNEQGQVGLGYGGAAITSPARVPHMSGAEAVGTGYEFNLVLFAGGTLQSWGNDGYGQLGNGVVSWKGSEVPTTVPNLKGVTAIAVSEAHALALLSNGTVASWGSNGNAALGYGPLGTLTGGNPNPTVIPGLSGVKQIATGNFDSAALLDDGTVVAWGMNQWGQLERAPSPQLTPIKLAGFTNVRQIAVGGGAIYGLLNDGTVLSVGHNNLGELGDGTTIDRARPVQVKELANVTSVSAGGQQFAAEVLAVRSDGKVEGWGFDENFELGPAPEDCSNAINYPRPCSRLPIVVPGLSNVTAVSAGLHYCLALSGGRVLGWGLNTRGWVGDGTRGDVVKRPTDLGLTGIVGISADFQDSIAVAG
jgi:alpha-tubulin suppressor-like RCC1 family protein